MMAPVESPVIPSPAKATKKANAKSETKTYRRSRIENAGNRIPAGPRTQRSSVCQPGIVLRNVHHFGIGRLDDHGLSLRCYRLLREFNEYYRAHEYDTNRVRKIRNYSVENGLIRIASQ